MLVQVLGEEGEVAAPAADPEVGGDGLELQTGSRAAGREGGVGGDGLELRPGSREGRGRRGSSCSRAAGGEGPMQEGRGVTYT